MAWVCRSNGNLEYGYEEGEGRRDQEVGAVSGWGDFHTHTVYPAIPVELGTLTLA